MGKYKMITFFDGVGVEALANSTQRIELNSVFRAGNAARLAAGGQVLQMASFLTSAYLEAYIKEAAVAWNLPPDEFILKTGKAKNTRIYVHPCVALLAAERLSPKFHVFMHKEYIEGKILEYRVEGASEFKRLNALISTLPDRQNKDNRGVYIAVATLIRTHIIGADGQWANATAAQTERRMELEKFLCTAITTKLITNYPSLKEAIICALS